MSTTDFDRTLSDWFEAVEPQTPPDKLLPDVFGVTARTGQRGKLIARANGSFSAPRFGVFRISPAFAFAMLALLAALVVGAVAAGALLSRPSGGWRVLDRSDANGFTWITGVASQPSGFAAIGNTSVETGGSCATATRARLWLSADGNTWSEHSPELFADARVDKLVTVGDSMYVIGQSPASCDEDSTLNFTARSDDGRVWTLVTGTEALHTSYFDPPIAMGGAPTVLAIYQEPEPPDGSGLTETRVMRVVDDAWQQVSTVPGVQIYGPASMGSTAIAVGATTDGEASLWRSTDSGATWSSVDVPGYLLWSLAAGPDGFVAGGIRSEAGLSGEDPVDGVVLTSPDGLSWTQSAVLMHQPMKILTTATGLLAVMNQIGLDDAECAEWATLGSVPIAVPSDGPTPTVPVFSVETPPVCIRYAQRMETAFSEDGVTWRGATVLPDRENDPPALHVPMPDLMHSIAANENGIVVSNFTFGGRLWFSPLDEFAPPPTADGGR